MCRFQWGRFSYARLYPGLGGGVIFEPREQAGLAASSVGILLIPMLYVFFQTLRERTGKKPKVDSAHHAAAPAA